MWSTGKYLINNGLGWDEPTTTDPQSPPSAEKYIIKYHNHFILQPGLGAQGRFSHGKSTANLKQLLIGLQLVNLDHKPELIVGLVLMQMAAQLWMFDKWWVGAENRVKSSEV